MTRSAATPYDKARAVEAFFKTQFSYSLDVERTGGDPLAEFLFETREGHCEYFATAMAITLRTLDIPARIVNGFQMGEYNDINNLYTVREADAHSWVEVYFAKADAWVEFDPTPAAGINDYSQGGLLARLRKYMEAAEVFWLDYIVTLDSDEQASIMVELQQRTLAMKDQLVRYYMDFKLWMKSTTNRLLVEHEWSIGDLLLLAGLVLVLGLTVIGLNILRSHRKAAEERAHGLRPVVAPLFHPADLAQVASGRARPPRVGRALLRADATDRRPRGACETARPDACRIRRRVALRSDTRDHKCLQPRQVRRGQAQRERDAAGFNLARGAA